MILFNGGGDDAFHANAVAPHYNGNFLAVLRQHGCAHRFGIFCAELEDVTNLHSLVNFEFAGLATRTAFTVPDASQISPLIGFDVALDVDAAQVMVILVGAGSHVGA